MTIDQKIGQLFMINFEGDFQSDESQNYKDIIWSIKKYHVGGLIVFGGTPYSIAQQLNEFQALSKVPLLISSDYERGVFQQLPNGIHFPSNMGIGATGNSKFAYLQGKITAQEARAIGVHMILAPVLDVNNNPNNPIINFRSYGESPDLVADMGRAFIRGIQSNGGLATAKHFPGHGDTDFDSHLGLPVLDFDLARLDSIEFKPFRAAISEGIGAIMTAHIALPNLNDGKLIPATTSKVLMTDILRKKWGYTGLVISDAYNMRAINPNGMSRQAIIDAINSGVDIILMPMSIHFAHQSVKKAYKQKKISLQTINNAVRRILTAKYELNLAKQKKVDLAKIKTVLESKESKKIAFSMAERSISWLRHIDFPKKLDHRSKLAVISVSSEQSLENPGRPFYNELRSKFPNAFRTILDYRTELTSIENYKHIISSADAVIVTLFSRTRGGKIGIGIGEREKAMVEQILKSISVPIVIVSFGSPYITSDFSSFPNHLAAYSYSQLMQEATAHKFTNLHSITGRPPVEVPFINKKIPDYHGDLASEQIKIGKAFDTSKLDSLMNQAITDSVFPGGTIVVGNSDEILYSNAFGRFTYDHQSRKVYTHTPYDIASLTKVMATNLAIMKLVGRGQLSLETHVSDILPEYEGTDKSSIQIKHLLTHTSGLLWHKNFFETAKSKEDVLAAILNEPLVDSIGAKTTYSDLGFILLMQITEALTGDSFDQYVLDHFYKPLKMNHTQFNPINKHLIPPTESVPWRGHLAQGEVHDENAMSMGGISGHAGLFSTAEDLARVCQMLLRGGELDDVNYLKSSIINQFSERAGIDPSSNRAYGWDKPSAISMAGKYFSDESYGHSGFTGTTIWIDPSQDVYVILLSNRVFPSRENKRIRKFRPIFHNTVMETFGFTELRRSYQNYLKVH